MSDSLRDQLLGLGFKPPRFLQAGDVVTCSISGLGSIRNRFVG